jgi:TolB-like protein
MQSRVTFITSVFLIMISGCAGGLNGLGDQATPVKATLSSSPPDWVLGKESSRFSQARYLIGVGSSDTKPDSAQASARSNLAKNLKVKIHSTMMDVSTTEKTYIESIIKTEVDTVLEGVEIKDGWHDLDKGGFYSLAVVERSLAAASIKHRVKKIEINLQRNFNEGMEAESRVDIMTALSHYLSGYQLAPSLSSLKSALYVITRSKEKSNFKNISTGEFKSKIKGIVNDLNLTTVSGDRQIVKTQKGLANPLIAKVYLLKNNNHIPVSNIPVVFKYESGGGELDEEQTSGPDGTVQSTIHKISSYEEASHVIAVRLDYSRIRSNFNSDFVENLLSPLKSKQATFNYAIQTPKWASNKSQAWRQSITDLSNQLIKNIPPERKPLLGVIPFKDLRHERITPFSQVLNADIKTILARAEDLKLKEITFKKNQQPEEIAKANGLDYYVVGSYRMERAGLEVRSSLIDTQTNYIQSSANILIERHELNPEDLSLIDNMADEFKSAQKKKSYQEYLEKLVAVRNSKQPFNVNVRTNKENYEIKDKIIFNIETDRDGYLTLLDINPNGDITVIFPNKFHRDNFIRAGKTTQVPSPSYGFEFHLQGPAGLERIKAIVTLNKISLLALDLDDGFHNVKRGTPLGTRTIVALATQVDSIDSSSWSETYSEIFIFKEGQRYTRGSRKIPLLER